jgi:hypothetical protein
MKLAQCFESVDVLKTHEKPQSLYPVVLQELRHSIASKFGPEYFAALWSEISPSGNIYRYNGYIVERRRHCEDLRIQLCEIADERAAVLGEGTTSQERLKRLITALHQAQTHGCPSKQGRDVETPTPGFPPLQEFVDHEVSRFGPLLIPVDADAAIHHRKCVAVAFFVFVIQILAPFLVFMNRWKMKSNYLRDPEKLFQRLTLREAFCFGGSLQEQLTTLMGVAFIFVIVFFVRLYVVEETNNANKSSRLPTDTFWMTVGIIANMFCCVTTVCAVPLLFWSEDTPTNIVLDAMTMLFIFQLDDISQLLGPLFGMTDGQFQRIIAWNSALLAQCPVHVRDLINMNAQKVDDLWCIKFDSAGNLLKAPGDSSEPKVCETRLMMCPSETQQLSSGMSPVRYYRSREHSTVLPSSWNQVLRNLWWIVDMLLLAFQFLLPPVWFIVNKPCYKR